MKVYFLHLDYLKGLAILLMVMGHALAWSYPNWSFLTVNWSSMSPQEFNASFVWKIIYSFHMPLLFFVSGFLFYKDKTLTIDLVLQLTLKRIQRLLIPYLTTGIFVYLLKGYFGYWFFLVLFVLSIIVLLELYFEERYHVGVRVELFCHFFMFVILNIVSRLCLKQLPIEFSNFSGIAQYYLSFITGYLLHKYSRFERLVLSNWAMSISFLSYILLMVIVVYYGYMKLLTIFIPLTAILFLYSLMKKMSDKGENPSLGGGNSLWQVFYGDLCIPFVFCDTITCLWGVFANDRKFADKYKSSTNIFDGDYFNRYFLFSHNGSLDKI